MTLVAVSAVVVLLVFVLMLMVSMVLRAVEGSKGTALHTLALAVYEPVAPRRIG